MFITNEGKDGAGKSTGSKYLAEKFEKDGKIVHQIHFPNYETPIGELIGDIINDRKPMISFDSLEMLYVADQQSWQEKIKDWLFEGHVVICDRYDLSTIAYYASKTGKSIDATMSVIYDNWQSEFERPDHTLIFECEGNVGERRPNTELDYFESHDLVREAIDDVYSELGDKISSSRSVVSIDTNGTIQNTRDQIDKFYDGLKAEVEKFDIMNLFPGKKNKSVEPF